MQFAQVIAYNIHWNGKDSWWTPVNIGSGYGLLPDSIKP